jgi:hypothetical protein
MKNRDFLKAFGKNKNRRFFDSGFIFVFFSFQRIGMGGSSVSLRTRVRKWELGSRACMNIKYIEMLEVMKLLHRG